MRLSAWIVTVGVAVLWNPSYAAAKWYDFLLLPAGYVHDWMWYTKPQLIEMLRMVAGVM